MSLAGFALSCMVFGVGSFAFVFGVGLAVVLVKWINEKIN
jgi:hypothetical protein